MDLITVLILQRLKKVRVPSQNEFWQTVAAVIFCLAIGVDGRWGWNKRPSENETKKLFFNERRLRKWSKSETNQNKEIYIFGAVKNCQKSFIVDLFRIPLNLKSESSTDLLRWDSFQRKRWIEKYLRSRIWGGWTMRLDSSKKWPTFRLFMMKSENTFSAPTKTPTFYVFYAFCTGLWNE